MVELKEKDIILIDGKLNLVVNGIIRIPTEGNYVKYESGLVALELEHKPSGHIKDIPENFIRVSSIDELKELKT